jgi:hypothetical protein
MERPGHLIASGNKGVWESLDGGVKWSAISEGLRTSKIHDLQPWRAGLVIASREGVHQLVPMESNSATNKDTKGLQLPPLHQVMDRAMMEVDRQLMGLEIQQNWVRYTQLPTLTFTGVSDRNRGIGADYGSLSSHATDARDWRVTMSLCFGHCNQSTSASTTSGVAEKLMVIDGNIVETESFGIVSAANTVNSSLMRYRHERSDYVVDLYTTYAHLLSQQRAVKGLSLVEQSLHALEQREVVARLNAATDGYFETTETTEHP